MKIKLILVLAVFLTHVVPATAQLSAEFSSNDAFALRHRPASFNLTAGFLQSSPEKSNAFAEPHAPILANSLPFKNAFVNCDDSNFAFAPEAAPCNGVSVTPIAFNGTSRTIEPGGTNNTVGVVYRYTNAGTAPDGTVLDALVTILSYSNNQDANTTNFSSADVPGATTGYEQNLQPDLNQESGTFRVNGNWQGSINYRIRFVITGTTTPKIISVAATTTDNDGGNLCGGTLQESVTYSSGFNQILLNSPTNQTIAGNVVMGPTTNQTLIGDAPEYANSALYINVSEINWSYSFVTSTNGCVAGENTNPRYGSLNMNCQIDFTPDFASVPLSGTVFNDVNGLTDSTVNGAGTNAGGLFANLLDGNGNVVSSVAVAPNGTYTFPVVVSGSYNVQISTNQGIESNPAPANALPAGWVNTGENLGAGTGNDGTINGRLPVVVAATAITNANFGIEQRPTASNNTASNQTNPGGTNSATIPTGIFLPADVSGGTISAIRITGFPTGATSFSVGTTTYYATTLPGTCPTTTCSLFPSGGVTVTTDTSGNPIAAQTVRVDPTANGATTVGIPYAAIDNAGVESAATATANVPFVLASISGTVFNDVNGLTDGIVNGTGTNTGGTLYANLLNSGGTVLQTITVPANGTYSFAGLSVGSYTVQISTVQGTVNQPAPATTLPTGWVNTGEFIGTAAGSDGSVNGLLLVSVGATPTSITAANFGIEQRPTANSNTAASQTNPGGTNNATVPATTFTATDITPGTVSSIRITVFPSNATSITINGVNYTSATFPTGGVTVPTNAAGNPTQTILVDPIDGAVTVAIPYVAIDNAGVASVVPATASVLFTAAPTAAEGDISGTLYFEGTPIRNALVVLIGDGSNTKTFTRTDADGKYLFEDKSVGRTYVIQPLSGKYSFNPATSIINLLDNVNGLNFASTAKAYRPKNDFDGDGRSDIAVFRPTDGNWYVLRSSDAQMSAFKFGSETDVPVSADFDGDGKTDYAVFRPSEGNWYIWQSNTQDVRVEQFGLATDELVPADYDGDGRADVAVYRNGVWYIRRSSDNSFEAKNYGADTDTPLTGDFDGDGKSDFSVFRPKEGIWFTLHSSDNSSSARRFGLETDVPATGDYDGDGFADIAQFRNGYWYTLNSTTDFEASRFGLSKDQPLVGDYDGDGRADMTVFRDGLWSIRNSGDGMVKDVYFGLPTDVLVK